MGNGPVIAIVDDDESSRAAMRGMVESLGYTVVAFASAVEFLESDRVHASACLIADVRMPGISGLDMHDQLIAAGHSIATIFLTAFPDEKGNNRAIKAGAVCYLPKPCLREDLLACIHSALTRGAGRGA